MTTVERAPKGYVLELDLVTFKMSSYPKVWTPCHDKTTFKGQ